MSICQQLSCKISVKDAAAELGFQNKAIFPAKRNKCKECQQQRTLHPNRAKTYTESSDKRKHVPS
jgi:hypothetical protein